MLLLDEPMSNLDAKLRVQTESVLAVIQRRLDLTTLMATHDQREAMVKALTREYFKHNKVKMLDGSRPRLG